MTALLGAPGPVVVVGAGPAGLTAAYELVARNEPVVVLEADDTVGGISRTVNRDGWRFDIGGHRFFTRVPEVQQMWHAVLSPEEFPVRTRKSRIYYQGALFDYPLKAGNALRGLGLVEAIRCLASYVGSRIRPPKDQSHFEGWVSARFGERLYRIFFKTYTEKVWGVPATEIQADWAAQRIKNLSLARAVWTSLIPHGPRTNVTSLIEEFHYPTLGPGMMWERARDLVEAGGGEVRMSSPVTALHRDGARVVAVGFQEVDGKIRRQDAKAVISTMPLSELVLAMDPPAPDVVRDAARALAYRDFLTVALVVPERSGFPDNWIYVHSPGVKLGRVQNFGAWSPHMVKPGWTCLGLEYFVNEGDELWTMADDDLIAYAKDEISRIGLIDGADVHHGYVVRMPKAYPVYDSTYREHVGIIREWLEDNARNVTPVGRNGMHKYNNQDHSMFTAMLAVENLFGAQHDIWSVNVEEEYHEGGGRPTTGRDAPILPSPRSRVGEPVTPAP